MTPHRHPSPTLLRIVALLAVAAGLVTTAFSLREASVRTRSIRRKQSDVKDVRQLQAEVAALNAARQVWADVSQQRLTPLEEVYRHLAADLAAPEFIERDPEPLADGWRRRRVEVTFHEAPFGWIGRFVARCAEARPPWRLAEIRVSASESARGYGRATLVFDGLECLAPEAAP